MKMKLKRNGKRRSVYLKANRYLERILHNWPIKIVSLAAALLLFGFYRISSLEERFFTVPLNININERLIATGEYPKTVRVTVRGRADDILLILDDDLSASVDFSPFRKEGTYTQPVKVSRKGAALNITPIEIRVEPLEITLSLEKKMIKSLTVKPSITGFPEKGYVLSQYFVTPTAVEVEGAESVVTSIDYVQTADIDVSSRKSSFTSRIRLRKPASNVIFPGGNVVEFTATITEAYLVRTLTGLDLIAFDLDSSLELEGISTDNSMQIRGKQLELETYTPDDFRFTVDCSAIRKPGIYKLAVTPDVPAHVLVLDYSPKTIEVHVKKSVQEKSRD